MPKEILIVDDEPAVVVPIQFLMEQGLSCYGSGKGLSLGADAYITKPFSNTELVTKVRELLEKTYEKAKQ